jgi:hypothetical protein
MAAKAKVTRHKAGRDQFFSKQVVVKLPGGKRKRVTFYADRPEDLDETDQPARKAPDPD